MIFLSAQPDDYYFLWQLKLQLYNFNSPGILPESIHILIGFDEKRGLSSDFVDFINENPEVKIYAYADLRQRRNYLSSIRPYLIARHLETFPDLEREDLFYHDSDIVFGKGFRLPLLFLI